MCTIVIIVIKLLSIYFFQNTPRKRLIIYVVMAKSTPPHNVSINTLDNAQFKCFANTFAWFNNKIINTNYQKNIT